MVDWAMHNDETDGTGPVLQADNLDRISTTAIKDERMGPYADVPEELASQVALGAPYNVIYG